MSADILNWSEQHREPPLAFPPISFQLVTQQQDYCPLFSLLPTEIRVIIFKYTLTDYESTDYFFKPDDSHHELDMRRDYRPRRSTQTQLLRTCQRIYSETWLMPFVLGEHIFYVGPRNIGTNADTEGNRTKIITHIRMSVYRRVLEDYVNNQNPAFCIPQIEHFRYYVHPKNENPAFYLSQWLQREAREFGPRCVTFSLSYKNSWMRYEYGYTLKGKWVNETRFPKSVTRIQMELGKFSDGPELLDMISDLISTWFFRRQDGLVFRAVGDDVVYRRWVARHNRSSQTQKVYVIPIIIWKPVVDFDPFTNGYECPGLDLTRFVKRLDRRPLGDITRAVNRVTAH